MNDEHDPPVPTAEWQPSTGHHTSFGPYSWAAVSLTRAARIKACDHDTGERGLKFRSPWIYLITPSDRSFREHGQRES